MCFLGGGSLEITKHWNQAVHAVVIPLFLPWRHVPPQLSLFNLHVFVPAHGFHIICLKMGIWFLPIYMSSFILTSNNIL